LRDTLQERLRREAARREREERIQRERAERQAKLSGIEQDFLQQKETVKIWVVGCRV
jgi:hypothetical protein